MNKTETLQAAEVMRRAAEGEVVEWRSRSIMPTNPWERGPVTIWDWNTFDYRTKSPLPEVKLDPFEEAWKRFCSDAGEKQAKLPMPQFLNLCGIDLYKAGWQACKEHYKIP